MKQGKLLVRLAAPLLVLFCCPLARAQLRLTEFMAANTHTLADENHSYEDWIEVHNDAVTNVNLLDWSLTDNAGNLRKWRFPATNLPPDGFIVVFASNKDRGTPGARLHTNFKLDAGGDYLALVSPAGRVVTEFAPVYPPQVSDVSYGLSPVSSNVTLIRSGSAVRALVPSIANGGDVLDYAWTGDATNELFSDAAWQSGIAGIGFTDGTGDVAPADIGLNLQAAMLNRNASAFVRLPFVVDEPTNYSLLTLRLKYNDGFVAWINGIEVAGANAALDGLAWDSAATGTNSGSITNFVLIGNAGALLREGTNILAI